MFQILEFPKPLNQFHMPLIGQQRNRQEPHFDLVIRPYGNYWKQCSSSHKVVEEGSTAQLQFPSKESILLALWAPPPIHLLLNISFGTLTIFPRNLNAN